MPARGLPWLLGRRLRWLFGRSRIVWTLLLLASILWVLYFLRRLTDGRGGLTPALVVIGVLLVLVLVVHLLPPLLVPPTAQPQDLDRAKVVGDVRTALVQALGGAALIGTLYFTAVSLQDSRTSTNRTLELTRQGQIADRFTRAVAQLGDAALDVRVGGIYALEQVARDATEDRRPIVEILASYLREHDRWQPSGTMPSSHPDTPGAPQTGLRADFQAIVTILRRVQNASSPAVNLRGVDLGGGELRDAHLEGADLGYAHLEGADLSFAHLEKADLSFAHLEKADLSFAHLEKADLSFAHLEGANLSFAHLEGANLQVAHLEGDDLADAHLEEASLYRAHLEEAFLNSAHLERDNLQGAHLEGANLQEAHLEGADLDSANLDGAHLRDVVGMTRAQLESTVGTPAKD
jgi:uncharacterized protein YjbI with pentapeptide repeats